MFPILVNILCAPFDIPPLSRDYVYSWNYTGHLFDIFAASFLFIPDPMGALTTVIHITTQVVKLLSIYILKRHFLSQVRLRAPRVQTTYCPLHKHDTADPIYY